MRSGQSLAEYGLLIATVAVITLLVAALYGERLGQWFEVLAGRITTN